MDKNNELEKDFSTLLFDAEENGNTAETLDSPANGETFQFTNIENSENASTEMFPTGELESAEAVFASAAGIEATAEVSETVSEKARRPFFMPAERRIKGQGSRRQIQAGLQNCPVKTAVWTGESQ